MQVQGVLITKAHGMGLEKLENFFNRLHEGDANSNLMFITQTKNVDNIIKAIVTKLDIICEGEV